MMKSLISKIVFSKFVLTLSVVLISSSFAQAETITCEGEVDMYGDVQKFTVTVEGEGIGQAYTESSVQKITIQGASLAQPNVISHAADYWDGHATGLISAKGFSMKYDKIYGCMKNVMITTDFRGQLSKVGETVGHIATSNPIALCKNETPNCQP